MADNKNQPFTDNRFEGSMMDRASVLIVLNDTAEAVMQTVTVKGLSAKGTELLDQTTFDFTSGSCTLKLEPRGAKFIRFPEEVK